MDLFCIEASFETCAALVTLAFV